ncbi:MAG: KEOPS complex kinase/ATPase Bud32, partial [archaeon]
KIIKERVLKSYRLAEIDSKLRKERTRAEAKLLRALERAGVPVPAVLKEDDTRAERGSAGPSRTKGSARETMTLEIEFIDGTKVRDYLDKTSDTDICRQIGELTEKMHGAGIVHGDLTTSNLILKGKKVYLIDLGLGDFSSRVEDKAVDLHLFKECLVSKHHKIWESCWKAFLEGYKNQEVLNRLKVVEARGRYKEKL